VIEALLLQKRTSKIAMLVHQLAIEEALATLRSHEEGLSSGEAGVLILLIDYTRAGQAVFGTAPIGLAAWLAVVPFAVTMLIAEEGRKAIVRVSERRGRETARVASVT